jgi:type II restriction enzyme
MKYLSPYKERINCSNADEVFKYLIDTLKDKITRWDYFVNWNKVYKNLKEFELDLNILNYLIGKKDVASELKTLLQSHPYVIRAIPILIACRENEINILYEFSLKGFIYKKYNFKKKDTLSTSEIDDMVEFAEKVGFLNLLRDEKIKNLVDYALGVEVGLDSNGRKNRGGTAMEGIVEYFLSDLCSRNKFSLMKEATSEKVRQQWGLNLTVDKSSRRIDFAISNGKKLVLIETNFYGGGGSKLKSTAGEYKAMYDFWKSDGHDFIWITDGGGWRGTSRPLRETFDYTDSILNLEMISQGLLEDIVKMQLK